MPTSINKQLHIITVIQPDHNLHLHSIKPTHTKTVLQLHLQWDRLQEQPNPSLMGRPNPSNILHLHDLPLLKIPIMQILQQCHHLHQYPHHTTYQWVLYC